MRFMPSLCAVLLVALSLLSSAWPRAQAVDHKNFRTCSQTGFCRRHRDVQEEPKIWIDSSTVELSRDTLFALARRDVNDAPPFKFTARFLDTGAVRLRLIEHNQEDGWEPRWESPDVVLEDNLIGASTKLVNPDDPKVQEANANVQSSQGSTIVSYTTEDGKDALFVLLHDPLRVELYHDGVHVLSVNRKNMMYFEHRRTRAAEGVAPTESDEEDASQQSHGGRRILDWGEDGKPIYAEKEEGDEEDEEEDDDDEPHADPHREASVERHEASRRGNSDSQDGTWEESFGSHRDTKPSGPMSVGADVSFPSAVHVYGIPEHASSFALKNTRGNGQGTYKEPYRLYNLDVFEYELDSPMALYGSIPFMIGHGPQGTAALFWNNPSETFVDIESSSSTEGGQATSDESQDPINSCWLSESGVIDLFLLPGSTPGRVFRQYGAITGTQGLPPLFALGYHQCRWNYRDEADVFSVDAKFEEHDFPYDVLWLDIEHTDGKRYFTWDKKLFPNPEEMQNRLASRGRKMVTIIDPHIKRDDNYAVHSEATKKGHYVRDKSGKKDFEGWCWPGSSSYLDFTDPNVREWWASRFSFENYKGSTRNLFTWIDMNEPSVFNGPEVTMNKDAKSIAGVEHREWHNLYGFYQMMATTQGHSKRVPDQNARSFVLSRAFYAGTQRYGAIWTGDNFASWEHLDASNPMLLSVGIAGLPFAGADVGGFFNNPSQELLIRWYQVGSLQPFFRAHAHIDTKRREPWLFGQETMENLKASVRRRYALLPYIYTLFARNALGTGEPVMRPMWVEFPSAKSLYSVSSQWMLGEALLVNPVTEEGKRKVNTKFPGKAGDKWYSVETSEVIEIPEGYDDKVKSFEVESEAPLDTIPVYQRGGTIVPRQERARRCATLMVRDPYTLTIALDSQQKAEGYLYLDDGQSFDYLRKEAYRLRKINYSPSGDSVHHVQSVRVGGGKAYASNNVVEKIVVLGIHAEPKKITAVDSKDSEFPLEFEFDGASQSLVVRSRPAALMVAYDFSIRLEF